MLKNDFKRDSGIIGDNRVRPTVWVQSNYILRAIFVQKCSNECESKKPIKQTASGFKESATANQMTTKFLQQGSNSWALISLSSNRPTHWEVIIGALNET